jgi:hypothetical protein
MQVIDITTDATIFYAVGVKGARNRKVYRADSASCGNKAVVLHLAELTAADNPTTQVYLVDAKAGLTYRDSHRTPLAIDAIFAGLDDTEDDVNLDTLSDDQL